MSVVPGLSFNAETQSTQRNAEMWKLISAFLSGLCASALKMSLLLVVLLTRPSFAEDARVGTLTLSDGTACTGEVTLTKDKKLELFLVDEKKRYAIDFAEVVEIRSEIEKESLEHPWHFVEESRSEKVYLPETYPLRKILLSVTLASGPTLKGHVTATPIYVRVDDEKKRYLLYADQKGEVGQSLEDLVYVKSVTFEGASAGGGKLSKLAVEAKGAREVRVVDAARDRGFEAAGKGAFRVSGLLPGVYDLFVRYDDRLRCGVTAAGELSDAERKELDARVAEIEEFSDVKTVRGYFGSRDRAKVLLEMRRTKDTTDKDEHGRSYHFVRWEVWSLHKLEKTWQIDARVFLFRERLDPDAKFPDVKVDLDPKLGGVTIDGDKTISVE